jgi:hypothetical protein
MCNSLSYILQNGGVTLDRILKINPVYLSHVGTPFINVDIVPRLILILPTMSLQIIFLCMQYVSNVNKTHSFGNQFLWRKNQKSTPLSLSLLNQLFHISPKTDYLWNSTVQYHFLGMVIFMASSISGMNCPIDFRDIRYRLLFITKIDNHVYFCHFTMQVSIITFINNSLVSRLYLLNS